MKDSSLPPLNRYPSAHLPHPSAIPWCCCFCGRRASSSSLLLLWLLLREPQCRLPSAVRRRVRWPAAPPQWPAAPPTLSGSAVAASSWPRHRALAVSATAPTAAATTGNGRDRFAPILLLLLPCGVSSSAKEAARGREEGATECSR